MNKNDGGQAFPNEYSGVNGMTLRDWFAGQALGVIDVGNLGGVKDIAKYCYQLADAMLEERGKP